MKNVFKLSDYTHLKRDNVLYNPLTRAKYLKRQTTERLKRERQGNNESIQRGLAK